MAAILQKRTAFGVLEDSLNIQGSITKSPTEQTYDGQVAEALQLVNDLEKQYKEKIRSLTERKATEAQVQELTAGLQASLTRARVNYQNLLLKRNEVAQAARNDLSLFGIGRIEKQRPPGVTQCLDGNFSTYLPGRGVCSYHGGPVWIKSGSRQAQLPKNPILVKIKLNDQIIDKKVITSITDFSGLIRQGEWIKVGHAFFPIEKLKSFILSSNPLIYNVDIFLKSQSNNFNVSNDIAPVKGSKLVQESQRRIALSIQKEQELRSRIKKMLDNGFDERLLREGSYFKDLEEIIRNRKRWEDVINNNRIPAPVPIEQPIVQPIPQQIPQPLGFYRIGNYTARNGKSGPALEVIFTAIPDEQIRKQLKDAYFWFNPQDKLWRAWDAQERRDLLERLGIRPGENLPQAVPVERTQRVVLPSEPRVTNQSVLAQRLRSLAEGMQAQIDRKFNTPLKDANPTARRANMISNMEKDGERLQKFQSILMGLATLADQNQLPPELQKIDSRALLETIFYFKDYPDFDAPFYQSQFRELLEILSGSKGVNAVRSVIEKTSYRKSWSMDSLRILKDAFQMAKRRKPKFGTTQTEEQLDRIMRLTKADITPDNLASVRDQLFALAKAPDQGNQAERQIQQMIYNLIGVKIPGYFNTPPAIVERLMSVALSLIHI